MAALRLAFFFAAVAFYAPCFATGSISSTALVEMREITSVSVSPNGELAVVNVSKDNPRSNKQELSWIIIPLHSRSPSISISGGEEIFDASLPETASVTRQALWSKDGKWFYYLRRDGEQVQLWETRWDGKNSRPVTHLASDVMDLKRSSEPDKFLLRLAPERAGLRKAEEDEYLSGVLYDDHVIGAFPLTRTQKIIDRWRSMRESDRGEWVPPGWTGWTTAVFDARSHKLEMNPAHVPPVFAVAEGRAHRVSVVALDPMTDDPYYYPGKYTIQLEPKSGAGSAIKCEIAACTASRISVMGWSPDGSEIYFLADSLGGPLTSRYPGGAAIYSWNPTRNAVRLIHDAGQEGLWGRLYNSQGPGSLAYVPSPIVGREIVLVFAGADQPPQLEAIDLDTGAARIVFDPNAELRSLTRGRAIWRTWESSVGYSGRGIMVLPDDYRPGEKYPAVITSYACGNGLLRGGSGDNAPEFVLAHQGFIAVCVDIRVREIMAREPELIRIYPVFCGIITGLIEDLAKEGKIDATRVGIAGQSLGASAAAYCISHSNEFAAAAIRHGSALERLRWELFDTRASVRHGPSSVYAQFHMPDPRHDPAGKWDEISVAHHASQINAPTLIQVDDCEYLPTLPLWSAMKDEGKTVEMHVFPEEEHLFIQPAHMLVNFDRQIDWFNFWLRHAEDQDPSKRAQYGRWNQLRDAGRNSGQQH